MKKLLTALSFLTIIPVKKSMREERDLAGSLAFFPIVGALIGMILALILRILFNLPDLVIGVIILGASAVITGAVHLDGFADTCDGFLGGRSKEKTLEIMRDSRIGAMGVIGIALLLLFKFTVIVSLPRGLLWKALVLSMIFSRWAQSYACLVSKYAREEGKAKPFIEGAKRNDVITGGVFTAAAFLLSMGIISGFIILTFSCLAAYIPLRYMRKRIGGMTGDTIGAISEIAETAVIFFTLLLTI